MADIRSFEIVSDIRDLYKLSDKDEPKREFLWPDRNSTGDPVTAWVYQAVPIDDKFSVLKSSIVHDCFSISSSISASIRLAFRPT